MPPTAPELFDYIIVGSGAAGSVLANRLSSKPGARVLLLEAGKDLVAGAEPDDIRNVFPLSMFNPEYFWSDLRVHARTEENSPAIPYPQGRVLGGSTAINGMWALRGTPADYDEWDALGAAGWGWNDVLPYFRSLETDADFSGPMHGADGPIEIRRLPREEWSPMDKAIQRTLAGFGWNTIDDMNADFRDGCGVLPLSISKTARSSAGIAYLSSAVRRRDNLSVQPQTLAVRLVLEDRRVIGVVCRQPDGTQRTFRGHEVILTAGALQTPLLLMRSGIGPAAELQDAGVDVAAHQPGVGQNLQNHPLAMIACILSPRARMKRGFRPAGATFLRWSSGVDGCAPSDMSMWVRNEVTWHALGRRMGALYPVLGRPLSRGRVRLGKGDIDGSPRIEFNFLSDERDLLRMMDAFRLAARIFDSADLRTVGNDAFVLTRPAGLMKYNAVSSANAWRGRAAAALLDIVPPLGRAVISRIARACPVQSLVDNADDLAAFIRAATVGGGHVCGTCRMGGENDPLAVVDPFGKVRGIDGLWVADTSVMPRIPSGNTHIPAVMVAEKIAAGIQQGH